MKFDQVPVVLLFLSFLTADSSSPTHFAGAGDVSVNCGSSGSSTARDSTEWLGDARSKFTPLGSSTASPVMHKLVSEDDPVPYSTARLSRSRFAYAFHVNSGQKLIRLHFNPTSYKGYKRFKDLFAVAAGNFILLSNFSASLTAFALGVNSFVKEFYINIEENTQLKIVVSPASSQSFDAYAFINGIEIVSVPASLSYFHGSDTRLQVVGKSPIYVDNDTALEIVQQISFKQDFVPSAGNVRNMFGVWGTIPKQKHSKMMNNVTWEISVDVGFRYLVRLYFSKLGLKIVEIGGTTFKVHINEVTACTYTDVVGDEDDEERIPMYKEYMMMMKGGKFEGKRDVLICLESDHELIDGHGPLEGFEVLKLSNHDNSLAGPNPILLFPEQNASHWPIQNLHRVLGPRNVIATVVITLLAVVNIIIHTLREILEARGTTEENIPSIRAKRLCRRFSLADMQLATRNFSDAHLIGRGGFGNVYKGLIDNGMQTVAIKRLKSKSSQGASEFLMEIETLTEVRHVNLVSLIGYCNENQEMVLVYEYMASGTLADILYKHDVNSESSSSLTWKQRLTVCIGAGRGLDYLHTGNSIIHRDVKSSNILLDDSFRAKVSDFGLAKHLSNSDLESHVSTKVKGTFGYIDPKYVTTGKLTMKSDTYAFGVVLLEVLSGRRAVGSRIMAGDERILTIWARENVSKGRVDRIVDPNLRDEISEHSLQAFVEIAEKCLHDEPSQRPTMAEVVLHLMFTLEQQESPKSLAPNELSVSTREVEVPFIDVAVELPLEKLQQLLLYNVHLIKDVIEQVQRMEMNLHLFKLFVKDFTKMHRSEDSLRKLFCQIHDVVYKADDIIDAFITLATESGFKKYSLQAFKAPLKLLTIAKEVEKVGAKVKDIYSDEGKFDFASLNIGDGGPEESEMPVPRQENVVGFEDEAEKLIGYLKEETDALDVISIIGMPGLGKTTLAGKIFHDPDIQYEFPARIWVYVSREFTKKKVFLDILREFTWLSDDMFQKTEMELAQLVTRHLSRGKFLIVLDDVWTSEDWDKLKIVLPKSNKLGKVLITSRHEEVAWNVNHNRGPHNLRFLTQEESCLLLQLEVFGTARWPSAEFEVLGKVIAEQCGRLPLAIMVIGGILLGKFFASNEMYAKVKTWEKVSQSVSVHLTEHPQRHMEKIIALSYAELPFHLRSCFLYFGLFPEDFEIPVWKLIRMWIAEGFVQPKIGLNLEETAERYLNELINRNLITVDKRKPDGKVKTCRIHDMLRDFCIYEAGTGRESFLLEMKKSNKGYFDPSIFALEKYRRLCIHSNLLSFASSMPYGPRLRSFVCFSKEDINLPAKDHSFIPAAFKLLRVLEVKPIKFPEIPGGLYRLIHLRYITLSFTLAILPSAFSKFWNIQTLIVDTTSRTLEVKADIWKLLQLRHFKTNALTILPKTVKSSEGGGKLQTLGTILPQNCTEEVFDRCHNLKTLGIRGKLSLLLDGKTGSFDSLVRLGNVERLKLANDVFPDPPSDGRLRGLPPPYQFPPKLRILSIGDTLLDWSQMSTLGLLENLEVLKLKDNAFKGNKWVAADGGFRNLEVLHIGRTDLIIWKASAHHFPRLRRVMLRNCELLQEIPIELADIPSLHLLDLFRSEYAAPSAKRIQEKKIQNANENEQEEEQAITVTFKLSIFPPLK